MNPKPISETEAIRSDIEMTRRRMDDTVEALSERLRGRHLVDEVIGFFRGGEDGSGTGARVREKISDSAGTAIHAVVDTVKQNPMPVLLITAGAAWLAYSASRGRTLESSDALMEDQYDPDMHYDRPLDYPGATSAVGESVAGTSDESTSKLSSLKDSVQDKASAAKHQVQEKLSNLSNRTKDKVNALRGRAADVGSRVRERAGQLGTQVQQRTRQAYDKTREQVVRTADQHPLEVGLGCLALGVLVGLAIPTPAPVNRLAGPTVERLRTRTRDAGNEMLQRGKRVVAAASNAVREEAQSQGLTFDRTRQSGEANQNSGASNPGDKSRAGTEPVDPSATRPVM